MNNTLPFIEKLNYHLQTKAGLNDEQLAALHDDIHYALVDYAEQKLVYTEQEKEDWKWKALRADGNLQ